MTVTIILGNQ